jgi:flagellin-specific chaperone FliS
LPVAGPTYLIPLKAKAWLDLTKRREAGEAIDQKDINKHKNDVFRLYQIIDPALSISLPGSIGENLQDFLNLMEEGKSVDLKSLGLRRTTLNEVIAKLRSIYRIGD